MARKFPLQLVNAFPVLRLYLRRSKADAGHQQFSLDVQRAGCLSFVADDLPRRGIDLPIESAVEYVDDDRAGDDFAGRLELQRLLRDVRAGDIVLCRDQSRLGRDAIDVTFLLRELVTNRMARVFYYVERQEVAFANAIDAAMTFVKGTGHQMELEAIRSRTSEALRSRASAGRIAGGQCFGYTNRRERDATGREFTVATINEHEAKVVRKIFDDYLFGRGLKTIVAGLNAEGVPPPRAGQRGTGSWSTTCIFEMLRRERYRGVLVHGRIKRKRVGKRRVEVAADPKLLVTREMPEWRIIDEPTWLAVQEKHEAALRRRQESARPDAPVTEKRGGNHVKYPLSGIGRCASCRGAIGAMNQRRGVAIVPAYGCTWHNKRGDAACAVSVRQPMDEIHGALADHLRQHILTTAVLDQVLAEVRTEAARQLAAPADAAPQEAELREVRSKQRNLTNAVMNGAGDVPEIISALKLQNDRIRRLEADLAATKRAPKLLAEVIAKVEVSARAKLVELRTTLDADPAGAREVYEALFPDGLLFEAERVGTRHVWKITGMARYDQFTLKGDPNGI